MEQNPFRIDDLPTELLTEIIRCFDSAPPSELRIREQPKADLFSQPNLKNISLVNARWRALALPILFKHVIWNITPSDELEPINCHDTIITFPILKFFMSSNLATYIKSFTMVVHSRLPAMFIDFETPGVQHFSWQRLFKLIDPMRISILATPQVLTRLLPTMLVTGRRPTDLGAPLYHILSLERDDKVTPGPDNIRLQDPRWHPLFNIRPWTHLLLNEGSSIRIYRNYEYFLHRPPSILAHLLGAEDPSHLPIIPQTLRSMSYIAIFPLASHFGTLVDNLPPLDKLSVQIVPQNYILWDPVEMDHVTPGDLWMERNSCYGHIMRRMLAKQGPEPGQSNHPPTQSSPAHNDNWSSLREFESGDAADKEAWEIAVGYVLASDTDWRVEREGVFVKRGLGTTTSDAAALSDENMDFGSSPASSLPSVIPSFSPW
ncbi:hypothetical protein QBC43DRAFT_210915 [Cladorrhinum sp. PSN259]|nr:hypothetical protein QBC43DRAFT_210915 [Cladorrhinum sp. PSN259]